MRFWEGFRRRPAEGGECGDPKQLFFLEAKEGKGERAPSQPQLVPLEHLAEARWHQAPGDKKHPAGRALSNTDKSSQRHKAVAVPVTVTQVQALPSKPNNGAGADFN